MLQLRASTRSVLGVLPIPPRLGLDRLARWGWRIASFVLVFGVWEFAGRLPVSLAFPPFSSTAVAFFDMLVDGSFVKAYAQTAPPLFLGLTIIGVGGVLAGVGMGLSRNIEWLLLPMFVILQTAPVAAIVPIVTYIYGIGFAAKTVSVVLLSAPLVVLNCYKGVRHTDPSLLQMCRSFLGTRRQEIFKIILPQASPIIFAGLRLGVSGGFLGIVLAEILITPTGIGDLITYNRSMLEFPRMYAAILSTVVLSTSALAILRAVERRLFGAARPASTM